ncbi:MAG: hypothetical protein ACYDAG_05610 [Chloroflexota bacterium]
MRLELAAFERPEDARRALEALGVDPKGAARLALKAIMRPVLVRGVRGGAGNLLKQEMLARGGDAAVPGVAVMHPETRVDVCLLGTLQDYRSLLAWLRENDFLELPELGRDLELLLAEDLKLPTASAQPSP